MVFTQFFSLRIMRVYGMTETNQRGKCHETATRGCPRKMAPVGVLQRLADWDFAGGTTADLLEAGIVCGLCGGAVFLAPKRKVKASPCIPSNLCVLSKSCVPSKSAGMQSLRRVNG